MLAGERILFLLLLVTGVGCVGTSAVPLRVRNLSYVNSSELRLQNAVESALRSRGWVIIRKLDKRYIVIKDRGPEIGSATVQIDRSPSQVVISLIDSTNLQHTFDRDGQEVISPVYEGWINLLEQDIQTELGADN